jgi:predicted TIM-barrel fold metal-dependent hydrolase
MMDRMDEEQERKGHYSPRCKMKPSEYVKRGNIFFAVEVEESALPLAAQVANDNALIWASDYPHERDQRDFSQDIPNLINRKDVSDELKRKIFWDNPLKFYPRLKERVENGQLSKEAASA